jgi:germination protein M
MSKKGRALTALLLALALLLAGCGGGKSEGVHMIYYLSILGEAGGTDALFPVKVDAEAESDEALAAVLLEQMKTASGEDYESPLTLGTEVLSVTVEEGLATVDLSRPYAALSGVDLTLSDACITLTLCQLPSVDRVSVLVEGRELPYRDRQVMSAMDVILSQEDDEVRTLFVNLFFLDEDTGALTAERHTLQLYEGQTKAAAVLEALLQGPETNHLVSVLPSKTEVVSSRVDEGVCYVTLSGSFLDSVPETVEEQELVLASLVDSLCSISDIQAVQLTIEGDYSGRYGEIDLSVPLSG